MPPAPDPAVQRRRLSFGTVVRARPKALGLSQEQLAEKAGCGEVTVRPEVVAEIKRLDELGILHSVASRNDHDAAMARLREAGLDEYFLHPQINWNPKSDSVAAVAKALNFGVDALAFVDDQPTAARVPDAGAHGMTSGTTTGSAWLPGGRPSRDEPRLFCVPNAGAAAAACNGWQGYARNGVRVCPVQLPGRAERFAERPHDDAAELVDALLAAVGDEFDEVYALFGHSMGAVVVHELARRLEADGRPPAHVYVSGRAAPHLAEPNRPLRALPLDELIAELRVIGGTPEVVLAERGLMERFQVLLRADFTVNETYRCPADQPMSAPLTVFGGDRDPRASVASLHAWAPLTAGPFDVRVYPGAHFYLNDRLPELVGLMSRFADQ